MTRVSKLTLTTTALTAALLCSPVLAVPSPAEQAASIPTITASTAPTLNIAQVRADVTLARNAYKDIHPGYTRFTSQATLDAAWDAVIASAEAKGGMSDAELYLAISETLALIRCDHTKAELSMSMVAARNIALAYLPLRWTIIEGRAVILAAPEGSGLNAGDEITQIDGRTIAALQTALHPYIPVDGYNDHVLDTEMTASYEFMGGAIDHFGALLWDVPITAQLEITSADGVGRTVALDRVNHADWKAIAGEDSAANFKDAVSFTRVGDRGAILRIDSFVNYRKPVDPDSLYAPVFEALVAEGRDELVLDLRKNGGGSTDASQGLFAYLTPETRRMKLSETFRTLDHDAYVDYINTWDTRAINPPRIAFRKTEAGEYELRGAFSDATDKIKPADAAFNGNLTILTSRDNSSGSTNLIAAVRAARDVTLIGEQTGGNPAGPTAGSIFFMTLPESGIKLRVPVIRFANNSGNVEDGVGLTPDMRVPDTVESLRAGRDPALGAALARISR